MDTDRDILGTVAEVIVDGEPKVHSEAGSSRRPRTG